MFGQVLCGVNRDALRGERGFQASSEELDLAGPMVCVVIRVQFRWEDAPGPGQADSLQTSLLGTVLLPNVII